MKGGGGTGDQRGCLGPSILPSCDTSAQTRVQIFLKKLKTTRILTSDFTSTWRVGSEVVNWMNAAFTLPFLGFCYPSNLKFISCQHLKIGIFPMKIWVSGSWKIRSDNSSPRSPGKLSAAFLVNPPVSHLPEQLGLSLQPRV